MLDKFVIVTVQYGGKDGYDTDKLILPTGWPKIWGEISRKKIGGG